MPKYCPSLIIVFVRSLRELLFVVSNQCVFLGFLCMKIEDGEIYASINQKDGMVCFHDNPEKYNNPAMLHKIDQEVKRLNFLIPF